MNGRRTLNIFLDTNNQNVFVGKTFQGKVLNSYLKFFYCHALAPNDTKIWFQLHLGDAVSYDNNLYVNLKNNTIPVASNMYATMQIPISWRENRIPPSFNVTVFAPESETPQPVVFTNEGCFISIDFEIERI